MTARVLISDKLAPEGIAILKAAPGLEIDDRAGIDAAELERIISGYDALIIRSGTKVTDRIVAAADKLRVIGRAGIGVDNVDVDAASKRGIVVMNTPGGNNVTTAEHTISMMLALARHIPQANATLRAGQWKRNDFLGTEVCGKTLGIIGIGNIGSIVADRAHGLHMKVIAYDPFITDEAARRLRIELVTLDELFALADFISVHTPLTDETRGLVGDAAFAKMKKGARIVNCARGGIVDEAALARAIESGRIAGAALDVFTEEPPAPNHPLLALSQVIATPHLGASTGEAQLNVAIAIAEQVRDFLVHGSVVSAVNLPSLSPEEADTLTPYLVLADRIGSFYAQLFARAPREVRVEYRGEVAERDCRPINAAVLKGLLENVIEGPVNSVNAPLLASERGINLVELRDSKTAGFTNSIRVEFVSRDGVDTVEGAVFGRDVVRFVRFNDFHLEAVPEGHILVLHNRDVPGVVGKVGTFLAQHQVNIAGLALGRIGGEAISFVHVDSPLDNHQLAGLRKLPDITAAQMVRLG
ncbi:MAG: phosphoglycerate dehydrogenase [Myxococcales bacterium]|nr:MAG: phosphoglycerate dehydrogenase [Myxococcales bacterium]